MRWRIACRAVVCCCAVIISCHAAPGVHVDKLPPFATYFVSTDDHQIVNPYSIAAPTLFPEQLWKDMQDSLSHQIMQVPGSEHSYIPSLVITPQNDESLLFTWNYDNRGDYNQNGIVDAADLITIADYFGIKSDDRIWENARVADGNGDGEVNVSDITPIAQNWLTRINGYFIQESATSDAPDSWSDIVNVQISDGFIPSGSGGLKFSRNHDTPKAYYYYNLVPYYLENEKLILYNAVENVRFIPPLPNSPGNFKINTASRSSHIPLEWSLVPWAYGYYIYRDTTRSPYVHVGDVISWNDTKVYDHYQHVYWIQSENPVGRSSISEPITGILSIGIERDDWYMPFRDSCHSATSGTHGPSLPQEKWFFTPSEPAPDPTCEPKLLGPPAVDVTNSIYVTMNYSNDKYTYNEEGSIYKIKQNGSLDWRFILPKSAAPGVSIGANKEIYIATKPISSGGGELYAISSDGNKLWSIAQTGSPFSSAPALGPDDSIYPGCLIEEGGKTGWSSLNGDGSLNWICSDVKATTKSVAAISWNGTLYVCNQISPIAPASSECVAITPNSGAVEWKYQFYSESHCSPCIAPNGMIVFASGDENRLYALKPDGTEYWQISLAVSSETSPVATPDGFIYCGSTDGSIYKIDSQGDVRWSFAVGGTLTEASAAIDGAGTVYIGSPTGMFYAINPDGTEKWHYDARIEPDDYINSSAAIGPDGTIYVVTAKGTLHAIGEAGT
jgi:hypothetical protein